MSHTRVRPNRHTLALAAVVLCIWYVGAAQENGSAYLLAFLATSLVVVSWFHARANVRSLEVRMGAVKSVEQGLVIDMPVVLTMMEGHDAWGLEILMRGAMEPVLVNSVSSKTTTGSSNSGVVVNLRVKTETAGLQNHSTVCVRSHYPLGFFTVEKVFELSEMRAIHPRAAGDLPLPVADSESSAGLHDIAIANSPSKLGEGDDFAGLRLWQGGESLRLVDWKAAARGRPLMVKQYVGTSSETVWLDGEAPSLQGLAAEKVLSQLSKWLHEAEAQGIRYGLSVPGYHWDGKDEFILFSGETRIEPSHGPEHLRRCLDELSRAASNVSRGDHTGSSLFNRSSKRFEPTSAEYAPRLAGRPLLLLCLAMLLSALPFAGVVAWPALATFGLSLFLRALVESNRRVKISSWSRLALVVLGVAGTYLSEHTLAGIEAGVAVMLCVTAGKLLEAHSPRDVQIVALLGWFLCACSVAIDQSIGHSLYAFAVMLLLAALLVRFRRGVGGLWSSLRITAGLLLQALPLVLLLFYAFPRGSGSVVSQLGRRLMHRTGMTSSLNPGAVAKVAQSTDRVFRAVISSPNNEPPQGTLYWRCMVLWQCQGLSWERGEALGGRSADVGIRSDELRQTILLEPTGDSWLPALDTPVRVPSSVNNGSSGIWLSHSDSTLRAIYPSANMRRYEVVSHALRTRQGLSETQRHAALTTPSNVSEKVRALALSFAAEQRTPAQTIESALDYFRKQGFRYTMEPGEYTGSNGLDEFLFERKRGFCEHYAASFATLMRLAGLPSRVVIGYLGGEYSERGNYMLVRQSDAHAWTEVWFEEQGWVRVDPTAAPAPSRLTTDLRTFMDSGLDGALAQLRNSAWGHVLNEAALLLDNINYKWYEQVVQYDDLAQADLFAEWGLMRRHLGWAISAIIGVFLLLLALVELWLRRPRYHSNATVRLWLNFCRKLAKAGVKRELHEGPLEYAARAALSLPAAATSIHRVAEIYMQTRYAAKPLPLEKLKRAISDVRL